MPFPPISPIPAPPTLSNPGEFPEKAQTFLAAFPAMRTQFNAAGVYLDGGLTDVAANAVSAGNSAGVATTQAGIATTQSGIATDKAAVATTQANTAVAFATAVAQNSGVSGRNLIINGSGRINQGDYVSGTAAGSVNQFALDQWFIRLPNQSLTFPGTPGSVFNAARMMTAPSLGVGQVVEGLNIIGGTYILNWAGTATGFVNNIGRAKGQPFTLPAGVDANISLLNGTFTDVQLELATVGSSGFSVNSGNGQISIVAGNPVPTAFERIDIGLELVKCKRYFQQGQIDREWRPSSASEVDRMTYLLPVEMRTDFILGTNFLFTNNVLSGSVEGYSRIAIKHRITGNAASQSVRSIVNWTASARQTP